MSQLGPTAAQLHLWPSQREAVERFFDRTAPERQILFAPVGTGKSTTASAILAVAVRRGAQGMIVLARANVVAQGIAWRAATDDLTPSEFHRAISPTSS